VAAEKLSVSFDDDLARIVRSAAAEDGVSLSAWLASAAQDRIRNRMLRLALDEIASEMAAEGKSLTEEEIARLVADARSRAVVTRSGSGEAA
jgi:hypothetical protein